MTDAGLVEDHVTAAVIEKREYGTQKSDLC
jgi:hypothetical protein